MLNQRNSCFNSRACFGFGLLFFFILTVYSNTFRASWHLDDYPNIIQNCHLHITDLNPDSIYRTFFSRPESINKLYRPFPCLTFAINWYFGKDNVIGYHIVNITIHFLTAFILFLTILNLFKSPNLKDKYQGSEYFIALLTATLWAINPIQTQAVTYIVQRMTSMAAMFYILSIFFYVKGRTGTLTKKKGILFVGCFLSFVLGLASKENTATLPVALILVEIVFFQDMSQPETKKGFGWAFFGGVLLLIGVGTLFMHGTPLSFLQTYEDRPFTVWQRLVTEPRILVYYLSQVFYPVPTRLSIEHDINVSSSLFHPWTSLPAILIIFSLIGLGLSQMRKRPILSFAILFFFLNHLIESTIIGLELAFEHRNYLPSLFLFLPVSIGIKHLLDYYYSNKKVSMFYILVSFFILLIIGLGSGTYIRNMAWATEKSLWEDAIQKAPESSRSLHNLAWGYYERIGRYDKAMELYRKAGKLKVHSTSLKSLILNNMANIYYINGNYRKAAALWRKAVDIYPKYEATQYRLALALTKLGDWEKALDHLDTIISKCPEHCDYLNLKGLVLFKEKRFEEALPYFRKCLKLNPNYKKAMVNMGAGFSLMGEYRRAEWFLRCANALYPNDILTLLWLIETNLTTDDKGDVDRYMEKLFASVSVNGLVSTLERLFEENLMVSTSQELLIQEIARKSKDISDEITKLDEHLRSQSKKERLK